MAFVIPTIYRAVDQMTGVQARIGASMNSLAIHAARVQRSFTALTPSFSATTNNMLELAKGAVTASAAIGAIAFSGRSLLDYETAVQSFRTIVSDLNDTEFAKFKSEIANVASATKKSTIDVAQSFEKIAGLNANFAKTAQGLGQVSAAAITLAKASRMELAPAAESLVGIMNQLSLSADQSDRVINALAAGQAVGAASITQTAEALTNFGASAKSANINVEQSIALVQTLAKFGQIGADAGDKLKTSLIRIQQTGLGYKSGQFNIVDALDEMKKKYDALGTARAKDAYLADTFGATQIVAGQILLGNIQLFKEFTQQVTGTSEAYKAAAINSNTLANRVIELKNKWVTLITTSNSVGIGIRFASNMAAFLTNNMEAILAIATPLLAFYASWKAYILAVNLILKVNVAAVAAQNFVLGAATVINGKYATSCFATIAGMNGMAAASFFLEMGLLGTIGVVGAAVTAIALLVSEFKYGYDSSINYVEGLKKTKAGLYELSKPLTEAQVKVQLYNKEMEKFHELQNYEGYLKTRSGFAKAFEPIVSPILHAQYNAKTFHGLAPLVAPTPQQFGIDSTGSEIPKSAIDSNSTSGTQKVEHHFKIELQQGGRTIGTYSSKDLMPSQTSTTA